MEETKSTYTPVPYFIYANNIDQARALRESIEFLILKQLGLLLEQEKIDMDKMRVIAESALERISLDANVSQLFSQMKGLSNDYSELVPVIAQIMKVYEEETVQKNISDIGRMLKGGSVDMALSKATAINSFQPVI